MKRFILAIVCSFISNMMLNLLLLRMGIKLPFLLSILMGMGTYFFWLWWFRPKTEDSTPTGM